MGFVNLGCKVAKIKQTANLKTRSRGSFLFSLVLFVAVLFGTYQLYAAIYEYATSPYTFQVSRVIVKGKLTHVSQGEIADAVGRLVGEKNLVTLDERVVQENIKQMPWVANALVYKQYPDTLVVSLVEHYPSALWKTTGIYDAHTQSVFYPDLNNFSGQLVRLSANHDSLAPELYEHASEFMTLLANSPYLIEEVQLDAARGYRVVIQEGVTLILGRESSPHLPLIRLNRFLKAFAQTGLKLKDVSYVDLRYDNGFAVGERVGESAATPKK